MIRRSDDTEEALRTRLQSYYTQTKPLVDFYKQNGLHCCVDASKSSEEVWAELLAAVSR